MPALRIKSTYALRTLLSQENASRQSNDTTGYTQDWYGRTMGIIYSSSWPFVILLFKRITWGSLPRLWLMMMMPLRSRKMMIGDGLISDHHACRCRPLRVETAGPEWPSGPRRHPGSAGPVTSRSTRLGVGFSVEGVGYQKHDMLAVRIVHYMDVTSNEIETLVSSSTKDKRPPNPCQCQIQAPSS